MTMSSKVLLIRHLPSVLTDEEKESLLKYFGAESVRISRNKGHLKYTAFADFPNESMAKKALLRLHQAKICGSFLRVEYAKSPYLNVTDEVLDEDQEHDITDGQNVDQFEEKKANLGYSDHLPPIAPHFGLKYPTNPGLKYKYPPPNQDILANICSALLTVPKLYYQVLHLMNKMHLMPPFAVPHMDPVQLKNVCTVKYSDTDHPLVQDGNKREEMETIDMSESESEYESGDSVDRTKSLDLGIPERVSKLRKRRKKVVVVNKKQKLSASVQYLKQSSVDSKVKQSTEIFDNYSSVEKKSVSLKLPSLIASGPSSASVLDAQDNSSSTADVPSKNLEGFGKLNPIESEPNSTVAEDQESSPTILKDYITKTQLTAGQLSSREMSNHSVFKNYKSGDPTCRLYIKNLPKRATEKDLEFIFGRFVNFEDQNEKNMFDVRLMTQGRMKGQAFIGMPSIEAATTALKYTNGYQLINKPMVVQFARSANPK